MRCKDFKNKLELYIDNELSRQQKAELERHLSKCPGCTKELEVLTSINTIGKMEIFSEPEPEYWNELSQNIMHQISGNEEKTLWLGHQLEQLKRILAMPKISYRLVGLAATAVIVFFIIHIAFFRQDKFELPIKIGTENSIQISDLKSISDVPQDKLSVDKEMNEKATERQITQEHKATKASAKKQKSMHITKSELTSEPPQPVVDDIEAIPSVSGELVVTRDATDRVISNTATQSLKKSIAPKNKVKHFAPQPTAVILESEKSDASIKVVAARSAGDQRQSMDSSFIHYNEIFMKVQQIEEMTEKIKTWEDFIESNPNLALLRKAKYQQALLYYKLAKLTHGAEEIKKAINFYQENAELLFIPQNADSLHKKLEALNFLLKKSNKNE